MPPYRLTAAELERARSRLHTPYVRPPPLFYNEDDDLSYLDQPTLGIRPNLEYQAELQADAREETMLWRADVERLEGLEVADLRRHADRAALYQEGEPSPYYELPEQPYTIARSTDNMTWEEHRARERSSLPSAEELREAQARIERNNFLMARADERAREREQRREREERERERELDRRRRRAQRIIRDDILPPYRDDDMYDQHEENMRQVRRNLRRRRLDEDNPEWLRRRTIAAWERNTSPDGEFPQSQELMFI